MDKEYSSKQLKEFHVVYSNIKLVGIINKQIKLKAISFILANIAKEWLYYLFSYPITIL